MRAALLTATLTLAGLLAVPQAALGDVLTPDSPASPNASATRTIYIIMVVLTGLVAVAVIAALLRAVAGGRSSADSEPQRRTRGTIGVQRRVGAGIGAAVVVLFVVGVVFTERAGTVEASKSGAEPITIQVDGQQWIWRYGYPAPSGTDVSDGYSPEAPFSYYELVVPVDTPITLDVASVDVNHRWWVPALARAVDAVPGEGEGNEVTFTADEVGTYFGRSTEFSGPGFATMRTAVMVVEPEEYEAFLKQRIEDIDAARAAIQDAVDDGTAPGVAFDQ